jgi:hypothetical protein
MGGDPIAGWSNLSKKDKPGKSWNCDPRYPQGGGRLEPAGTLGGVGWL